MVKRITSNDEILGSTPSVSISFFVFFSDSFSTCTSKVVFQCLCTAKYDSMRETGGGEAGFLLKPCLIINTPLETMCRSHYIDIDCHNSRLQVSQSPYEESNGWMGIIWRVVTLGQHHLLFPIKVDYNSPSHLSPAQSFHSFGHAVHWVDLAYLLKHPPSSKIQCHSSVSPTTHEGTFDGKIFEDVFAGVSTQHR